MIKRLMVVEDDVFLSKVYAAKLKHAELEVTTFKSGVDVFTTAKKSHPNLIVLDIVMPDKDGFEVLEELQSDASTKNIPVVVLSGLSQKEDTEKSMKLGAREHLVKNQLTFNEVKAILQKYL